MPLIFELFRSQAPLHRRGKLQVWSEPTEIVICDRTIGDDLSFELEDRALETLSEVLSGVVRKQKEESREMHTRTQSGN